MIIPPREVLRWPFRRERLPGDHTAERGSPVAIPSSGRIFDGRIAGCISGCRAAGSVLWWSDCGLDIRLSVRRVGSLVVGLRVGYPAVGPQGRFSGGRTKGRIVSREH